MNLVWLDLCSGLGGASQPALDRGWNVLRVDIDPRFKPDIVGDLTLPEFRAYLIQYLADRFSKIIFGPVRAMMSGHAFWGNFPGLLPNVGGHKWRLPPSPDRAAIRGKIPYEIGEAICRAVEERQ